MYVCRKRKTKLKKKRLKDTITVGNARGCKGKRQIQIRTSHEKYKYPGQGNWILVSEKSGNCHGN